MGRTGDDRALASNWRFNACGANGGHRSISQSLPRKREKNIISSTVCREAFQAQNNHHHHHHGVLFAALIARIRQAVASPDCRTALFVLLLVVVVSILILHSYEARRGRVSRSRRRSRLPATHRRTLDFPPPCRASHGPHLVPRRRASAHCRVPVLAVLVYAGSASPRVRR